MPRSSKIAHRVKLTRLTRLAGASALVLLTAVTTAAFGADNEERGDNKRVNNCNRPERLINRGDIRFLPEPLKDRLGSGMQEQLGVYGPLIIDPAQPDPIVSDREHIVQFSDWTFENPHHVAANLKKMAGYYNFQRRTAADLFARGDAGLADRAMWGRMRMDPSDIADVTGAAYHYLLKQFYIEDKFPILV